MSEEYGLKVAAQKAVDRCVAARAELAAAIEGIDKVRADIVSVSAEAVAFIDAYMNPAAPNPEPLVPEEAAPAPEAEPPVFTTVDDVTLDAANTSGGEPAQIADEFVVMFDEADAIEAQAEAEAAPVEEMFPEGDEPAAASDEFSGEADDETVN